MSTTTTQRDDDDDCESDPDETKGSLVMRRRRAASDDEEDRVVADRGRRVEGGQGEGDGKDVNRAVRVQSDESDGEGAAAEYDEDGEEEEFYSEGEEEGYREGEIVARNDRVLDEGGSELVDESVGKESERVIAVVGATQEWGEDQGEEEEVEENVEGKKENEPFAVPTAGAFYMHDDRFRDNMGARNRRTFVGRKLWETKDNRKWGHDKYEEMTIQESRYDERRRGRGNYRGRGRNRAMDRGYHRGGYGARSYANNQNVPSTNNSYQNQAARSVRGRGPIRYGASFRKGSQAPSNQMKQRSVVSSLNREPDVAPARTQTFGSSLNSASPPFYPSSSSSKDLSTAQRKDVQLGSGSRINHPTVVDDDFSVPEPNNMSRGKNVANSIGMEKLGKSVSNSIGMEKLGKNVANSIGMEKLSVDDSFAAIAGKPSIPVSVAHVNGSQSLQNQNRAQIQGRAAVFPMSYQPISQGPVGRASSDMQVNFGQKVSPSNRVHATPQQPGQHPGSGKNSSPSKGSAATNSYEIVDTVSPTEASKLAGALVPKGNSSVQGSGRGSVIYSGPPVAGGNASIGQGDQNFPGTPAFLPVMQFGGQHTGGLGLPAVGMAFPGYVAQPQLGMGNSEMTWLPVLTGAAGALGAAYCPPYITVDSSYQAPSGQTASTSSSSKESHSNIPNNEWKHSQRPEAVNEDYGQRQNKPRRYSEMNFGQ